MRINSAIASLPAGYLFAEVAKRVRRYEENNPGKQILRLGIGDVTRPLGQYIAGAFARAADEMGTQAGFHGYAPDGGYPFLIEAIAKHDYQLRGIHIDADEIFICDGAKTDTGALQELFSSDALIAVTDPVYPVYVDANAMAGRLGSYENSRWSRLCYLPCTAENGFVPALPERRVDVVYLCYPNNPTGTVLTKAQLKRFVDWARENEAVIIYDAAYKAYINGDDVPHSIYDIEGAKEVAVECCSYSKTAGFTGVRCGWTVVPKALRGLGDDGRQHSLNTLWRRRIGSKSNGVSYPVQRAALATYDVEGLREVRAGIEYYMRNTAVIRQGLENAGIAAYGGVHAPYIWMRTPNGMDSWAFFDRLLEEAQVVGTPGSGFGPSGEGYFRLTAFNTLENTSAAVARIRTAL